MTVTEKVAYLKGLAEGLELDESTKEGKVLKNIIDVLTDMADEVEGLADFVDELSEQVDAVDEDLDALENDYYDEDEEDDEDGEFYDITCPKCGEEFCVDEETLLDGSVDCPECGETIEFEIECDGDCASCDGDCDEND